MFSQQPVVPAQWDYISFDRPGDGSEYHAQILLKGNGDVLLQNIETGDARTIHADLPVVDISYNLRFTGNGVTLFPVVMLGGELRYLYVLPQTNAPELVPEARVIPHDEALQLNSGYFPLPKKIRHVKRLAKAFFSGAFYSSFLYIDSDDNLNYMVNVQGVGLVTTQLADVADFYVYRHTITTLSGLNEYADDVHWPSFCGVAVKTDGSVMSILCTRTDTSHSTTPVIQPYETYYPCRCFSAVSDIKLMRLGNSGSREILLAVGTSGAAEICITRTLGDATGNIDLYSINDVEYRTGADRIRLHLCDTGFEWFCTAPASFGRLIVWKSAGEVQYRVFLKNYDSAKGSWFRELTMDEGKEAGTLGIAQRMESSACYVTGLYEVGSADYYGHLLTKAGDITPFFAPSGLSDAQKAVQDKYYAGLKNVAGNLLGMASPAEAVTIPEGTQVTGVVVSGEEPAGTKRRVLFKVGDTWNRLDVAGGTASLSPCMTDGASAVALPDAGADAAYILAHGNTAEELSSVTAVPGFSGQSVLPRVALFAPAGAQVGPRLGLSLKMQRSTDTYVQQTESQEYALKGMRVVRATVAVEEESGGKVEVRALVRTGDAWSRELSLDELKGQTGDALKFRVTYTATTIGVSKAHLARITVRLRGVVQAGATGGEGVLVTKTQSFDTGMMYSRLYVKHAALRDARISADVMFRETPKRREMYKIAEGTGEAQTVKLSDTGIDFSSLRLFANDETIASFDFNSMENTVSFLAPSLCTVFASYAYEVEPEVWQPMQAQETQPYTNTRGYASTSFAHEVTGTAKGYSAVRIRLEKPEGKVEDALLGVGTGRLQTFFLPHDAKTDTIQLKNGPDRVEARNWSYDAEHRMLQVIALKDREVTASYEFTAENPKVYGMVAAWNQ